MKIFEHLFSKRKVTVDTKKIPQVTDEPTDLSQEWTVLSPYIAADPEEYALVSVIATSLAAGEQPDTQFKIKKILKRNPEAKLVSLVAASLAAGALDDSQFIVKKIAKKKTLEDE